MTEEDKVFFEKVSELLSNGCYACSFEYGEYTANVETAQLLRLITLIRDHGHCLFNQLSDLTVVDYPNRAKRFEVVYQFLSMTHNKRMRLKVCIKEGEEVPSIISAFPSANWYEREAFDLYGIIFTGHPDLRRILTDYSFDGHPLRKDFPLTGYVEVRYDDLSKKVVYEPVNLPQAYRDFDYLSPWEGMLEACMKGQTMSRQLPGDEKHSKEAGAK